MKAQRLVHRIFLLTIPAGASLLQGSCTILGLGVGNLVDAEKKPQTPVRVERADSLRSGMKTTVQLHDGWEYTGKLLEIRTKTPSEYAAQYEAFRNTPDALEKFPGLGDTLALMSRIVDVENDVTYYGQFSGIFLGFDRRQILIHEILLEKDIYISLQEISKIIDPHGVEYDPLIIGTLIMNGSVPFLSLVDIELMRYEYVETIPLEQVDKILIKTKTNKGKRIGAITGASIDAAVIVVGGACLIACIIAGNLDFPSW